MKRRYRVVLLCAGLILSLSVSGQSALRVVFYNVENYFDCVDDSITSDEDFTPDGNHHWTWNRYWKKTENIAKVFAAIGQEGAFPGIIGMAEVENQKVVQNLLSKANMKDDYRIVHKDSPDRRGIDVCLVYNRFLFKPENTRFIKIDFPGEPYHTTRDILYVCGKLSDGKDLHVVVSHWPSKSGGEDSSRKYRFAVADRLRILADSVLEKNRNARLIIMGDFNDAPYELSVTEHLKAFSPSDKQPVSAHPLYDLMSPIEEEGAVKSYKYHGVWSMLDQMVVSSPLRTVQANVFHPDFLMTEDAAYMGKKPWRTYIGYRYQGGFSDHLPVWIDIPLAR